MAEGTSAANLAKVEHIVVLMMENRSFDHMLGYLSLEGGRTDVDGLRPEFANTHDGHRYPVHHLGTTAIATDPDHSADAVELQLGGGAMDGFVASFAKTLADHKVPGHDAAAVMGYYTAADVPVYDHLARDFAICDRWFSSVPGATWPNRLYALCGRAAGSRDDLPPHVPPIYRQPSFVRHLDAHGVSWRWYSFEAGTLRLADVHYRLSHHHRFRFFSRENLNWKPELLQLQPDRYPAQRRPRARGHQGRPGVRARHLPRAGQRPAVGKDAADHLLRRAWRLLRSRPAASGAGRRPADVRPLRCAGASADRLTVDRARRRVTHAVRPHLHHQDDPAAVLPGRARPARRFPAVRLDGPWRAPASGGGARGTGP